MKWIKDYGRAGFWVTLLSLLAMFVLGWLAHQSDIQLARDTGQFRKPQLTVGFGTSSIEPSASVEILFGARDLNDPKAVMIAALPLVLTNSGDASLDDLTVTFRYNKIIRRDALEELKYAASGSAQAQEVKHTFNQDGEFQYSSYLVPALHPKVSFGLGEPIHLARTAVDIDVPFETRDQQHGTAKVHVDYAIQFLLSIAARNTAVTNYTFDVSAVQADSIDSLSEIAGHTRIAQRGRDVRAAATFPQYLRALLLGVREEKLYLVFPEFDSRPAEDGRLYNARPDPRVRQLSFRPISWRYLFHRPSERGQSAELAK
jgi:hypothetical protein